MDLAYLSGTQPYITLPMWVSGYDVNCQYRKNFVTRMTFVRSVFGGMSFVPRAEVMFPPTLVAIGKFHLPAHKASCRFKFSYNFLPGVGMTDGEASERIWAVLNSWSTRTKEMTWGHRHDVLNDVLNDMNVHRVHAMRMCSISLIHTR